MRASKSSTKNSITCIQDTTSYPCRSTKTIKTSKNGCTLLCNIFFWIIQEPFPSCQFYRGICIVPRFRFLDFFFLLNYNTITIDIIHSFHQKCTAADDYFFSTIFSNFFPVGQFSSGQAYFFVFTYFKNSFLL